MKNFRLLNFFLAHSLTHSPYCLSLYKEEFTQSSHSPLQSTLAHFTMSAVKEFQDFLQQLQSGNVEPRTYIVTAIVIIFTLGMISILLTPEEEQFYESASIKEEGLKKEVKEEDEEEEETTPVKTTPVKTTPVKTPTKGSGAGARKKTPAAKKNDVLMSPVTRSGRVSKKPVHYEPNSPGDY